MIEASYSLLMPLAQIISKPFSRVGPVIPILQVRTWKFRDTNWEVAKLGSNVAQSALSAFPSPLVGRHQPSDTLLEKSAVCVQAQL